MRSIGYWVIIVVFLSVMLANVSLARAESDYSLDLGEVHKGIFTLNYDIADKKAKLMVQKGGTTLYYNLVKGITSETFPLL